MSAASAGCTVVNHPDEREKNESQTWESRTGLDLIKSAHNKIVVTGRAGSDARGTLSFVVRFGSRRLPCKMLDFEFGALFDEVPLLTHSQLKLLGTSKNETTTALRRMRSYVRFG